MSSCGFALWLTVFVPTHAVFRAARIQNVAKALASHAATDTSAKVVKDAVDNFATESSLTGGKKEVQHAHGEAESVGIRSAEHESQAVAHASGFLPLPTPRLAAVTRAIPRSSGLRVGDATQINLNGRAGRLALFPLMPIQDSDNHSQDRAEMSETLRKELFAAMGTTGRVESLKNMLMKVTGEDGGINDAFASIDWDSAVLKDEQDYAEMSQSMQKQAVATMTTTDRVQRLKNLLTDKLILNVLTSSEFAMRLDISGESSAKIDYPNLLKRIQNSIDILQLRYNAKTGQEDELMQRLMVASEELSLCMTECDLEPVEATLQRAAISAPLQDTVASTAAENDTEALEPIPRLNFVVREDGTVDYDELLASSREVARFGVELWERLNARDSEEELPDLRGLFGQAPVESEEVPAEVQRLQAMKNRSQDILNDMFERGVNTRKRLRLTKEKGGSISNDDVGLLRAIDNKVEELRRLVTLCELNLDVERICDNLAKDIQESVIESLDLKLIVAEVNLIERQLLSVQGNLGTAKLEEIMEDPEVTTSNPFLFLVDDEELGLIRSNIEELKTRLAIEGSLAAPIDYGTIGDVLRDYALKVKAGFDFYGGGTQMLGSDLQYTGRLFLKALKGQTLLPREASSFRRTAKDLATLVPFTIILLTPITPVGHVLVFGSIQKFFPEFFPSFFTTKRQNLRRLYSDVLTSNEEALLGPPPKPEGRWQWLFNQVGRVRIRSLNRTAAEGKDV